MTFRVGDKVVYPNQGVAYIKKIVTRKIVGQKVEFFLLEIEGSSSTVMIPLSNIDEVGLRRVSSEADLKELFSILQDDSIEPEPDWKKRYKENVEFMGAGSLLEVGQVVKSLHTLSGKKNLGLRDQRMLDRATQLIVSEIAAVKNLSEEEASEEVDRLLTANSESAG